MKTIKPIFAAVALLSATLTAAAQKQWVVKLNDGTKVTYNVEDIKEMYTTVVPKPSVSHEYVDLGLSVKWATCNIDAESCYDSGGCFA